MSNNEHNLKKLNKGDISNVAGGWYVTASEYESPINDSPPIIFFHVYDDNGEFIGAEDDFADVLKLAREHNCKNFDLDKSELGSFSDDYKKILQEQKFLNGKI